MIKVITGIRRCGKSFCCFKYIKSIQAACDITSEEKQSQEFRSLRNIPDSFKKIVIVGGTAKPWRNEEGFVIMGMKYFLLNSDSLEF